VRTLVLRLTRATREPAVIEPHAPGTLHHLYVITGRLRTGPVNNPVELSAGISCVSPATLRTVTCV
jgi:hypothetical protein